MQANSQDQRPWPHDGARGSPKGLLKTAMSCRTTPTNLADASFVDANAGRAMTWHQPVTGRLMMTVALAVWEASSALQLTFLVGQLLTARLRALVCAIEEASETNRSADALSGSPNGNTFGTERKGSHEQGLDEQWLDAFDGKRHGLPHSTTMHNHIDVAAP